MELRPAKIELVKSPLIYWLLGVGSMVVELCTLVLILEVVDLMGFGGCC